VTGLWFSQSNLVSSTNKTDRHDITEILLKVTLNTITLTPIIIFPLVVSEEKNETSNASRHRCKLMTSISHLNMLYTFCTSVGWIMFLYLSTPLIIGERLHTLYVWTLYIYWRWRWSYQEGRVGMPLIGLTQGHVCACLKPGPGFPTLYAVVFFVFSEWW